MSKVIEHTFEVETLELKNGHIETVKKEEKHLFSLVGAGFRLFEQEYGSPLFNTIMNKMGNIDINQFKEIKTVTSDQLSMMNDLLDVKFLSAVACASYLVIEDNEIIHNDLTATQFKETKAYQQMSNDYNFIVKLLDMIVNAMPKDKSGQKQIKQNKNIQKKR